VIVDLGESRSHEVSACDVCVVGSGPAGATLARELAGRGSRVVVLESGKRDATPLGDRLRRVVSEGIAIKERSRERALGGASTTWTGLSAPLDPVDLAPRPWAGIPGWPIPMEELDRWYARAAERYRFPDPSAFHPETSVELRTLRDRGDIRPRWAAMADKVFLAPDPAQHFGREWVETYESPDVELCLDATLLELVGENPGRAAYAVVRSSEGRVRKVHASTFVLAAGGIENARLLLASRTPWSAGLGNGTGQVGRYMMNHPKAYRGVVRFARPVSSLPFYFGCLHRGFACYAGVRLRESEQHRRRVLNSYVRLEPVFPWTDDEGVDALVELVKRTRGFYARWKARRASGTVELLSWAETGDDSDVGEVRRDALGAMRLAARAALHAPQVVQYLFFRLSGRRPRVRAARLRNFMEMEPHPANRVTLSDERDEYGQPVAAVRHAPTTTDRRSLIELHRVLEEELRRTEIGRIEDLVGDEEPWPIDLDASHHMGTTRMGLDPASSVVNADLRLHDVDNVYVTGGSVFPTSGCANPTYTIVALSIRLAAHLAGNISRVRRGNDQMAESR
jgi:choline dehydrogenase-like flavoprotein